MKHVVKPECTMLPSSAENKMPFSCGRTPLGAMKLNAEDDDLSWKKYIDMMFWSMKSVILTMNSVMLKKSMSNITTCNA